MKNFGINIIICRKIFYIFLCFVMLLNTFSFISKQNPDLSVVDDFHVVSSIVKHYNLLVFAPIKIISECFNIDLVGLNNIGNKQTSKSNHKNNNEGKITVSTTDFAFSIVGVANFFCSFSKFIKYDLFGLVNKLDFNKIYYKSYIYSAVPIFIFVFVGCMVLARGDTENNIIINKIRNKKICLV